MLRSQKTGIKLKLVCAVQGCGKPLGKGRKSLCHMHYSRLRRRSKAGLSVSLKSCLQCGSPLKRNQSKYCSRICSSRHERGTPEIRQCIRCSTAFETWERRIVCSAECKQESRRHNEYKRTSRKKNAVYENFTAREIFERDAWRCQLCFRAVNRKAKWPHPKFPTIDHIVPLAKGGSHTRLNVQCAHLECNLRKSAKSMGQLRLFG
jgi:5-methylcytosine-specific restriction endonuclease McrA